MPQHDESWRPDRVGMLGIIGFNEQGAGWRCIVQFIPFRSAKVLGLPGVVRRLRDLASITDIWLGLSRTGEWPPSNKIHLNGLPNRRAWRKLRGLQFKRYSNDI
jgi:hypothetical protein